MQISIGPEFLPDYRDVSTNSLTVPVGETVNLMGDQDIDAIFVEGTLRVGSQLTLCYVNITIVQGGRLEIETDESVEIIKKAIPIDTDFDPFQWGHGVQCFGDWIVNGKPKTAWGHMSEASEMSEIINLDFDPAGWEVGDQLLIPDTRQVLWGALRAVPHLEGPKIEARRESPVFVEAINGREITISKPLDFDHLAVRSPNGEIRFRPVVANLTRNIVFRSEDPDEINHRAHSAVIHTGHAHVRHATFLGMGRTRPVTLDSTDSEHVGTNQIAKYAFHFHHVHAGHGRGDVTGCVLQDTNIGKWGLVVHGTHDQDIVDCIADGFAGGFVTEDGYERGNLFKHNLATGCRGVIENGRPTGGKFLILGKNPGAEGAGFWFHGSQNRFEDCCAINNDVGMNFVHISQVQQPDFDPRFSKPISMSEVNCISNHLDGFETWRLQKGWIGNEITSANNGRKQNSTGAGETTFVEFHNMILTAQGGQTQGLPIGSAYVFEAHLQNAIIEGCELGLGSAQEVMTLDNVRFQNVRNAVLGDRSFSVIVSNVTSEPLPGFPESPAIEAGFPIDNEPPPPEPEPEVWELASIGPPFSGDETLRVRNGLIEKLKT